MRSNAPSHPNASVEHRSGHPRRSWQLPIEDGAHAGHITASERPWLAIVEPYLTEGEGRGVLRRLRIGVASALAVARHDARTGGYDGRSIATSNYRVARDTGVDERAVRRVRVLLTSAGFMVTVTPGRRLTKAERAVAAATHGGKQRGAASNRALTFPSPEIAAQAAASSAPLKGTRRGSLSSSSRSVVTKRAGKRARGEAKKRSKNETRPRCARSLDGWKAASQITRTHRHLDVGHLGRLVDLLTPYIEQGWTAHDLVAAINDDARERGWNSVSPVKQRNPLGLFAAQLRRCANGEPPAIRRRREAERRAARVAAQREAEAEARLLAVPKPASFDELRRAAAVEKRETPVTPPPPGRLAALAREARAAAAAQPTPKAGPQRRAPGRLARAARIEAARHREAVLA